MKRTLLIAIAVLLVAAVPAEAKGLRWIELCGPSDCNRMPARAVEGSPLVFPPWVMSGAPDRAPARASGWLRVRVAADGRRVPMRSVVMPEIGYAGGNQGGGYGFVWERLGRDVRATYDRLARGLERYPAATAPGLPATSFAGAPTDSAAAPLSIQLGSILERAAAILPGSDPTPSGRVE